MNWQNKEAAVSNSPKMERKQRGKFVSLSKQDAKIVLETYIKRSLSNRESKSKEYKKERKVKRSVSDVTRFKNRVSKLKTTSVPEPEVQEVEKKDSETQAKTVKKQSWFKSFLNQLFKKEENISDQTVSVVSKVGQVSATSTAEGHSDQTTKKNSFGKAKIRKALSFKKNNVDEKLKRPTNLPLKRIARPLPLQQCEKNEDSYYEQVSEEIELLVKETENLELGGRKQSLSGDLDTDETMIKKIVAILQKEGDAYDRKIKEDPALNNFFKDISYNSFKQLADVYVDQGIKRREPDVTEDMKFAFSVHFTKQVVGLSTHPVNRIMGFGTKYLQDTLTWLSYSRENLTLTADPEECLSPD
ncbi:apoptosis facilitator Bcl-2-like protein 14 isoform X2 [Bufo gargarizans]|uniref:apoptosis facilitator Bcl-2-like protein 14 isoform X2 n=1 Tax=Bufo gargarizans TaxID=30331 RepID=UPI001CF2F1CC|nr:apoptosis facilitator Bcl-2-like protein 14 isoform X2 [Bufo gargarizans]